MDLGSQPGPNAADGPVDVTVLGVSEIRFEGRVTDCSFDRMRLLIPQTVAVGAAVKVEWSNTLLLGEVCYCEPQAGEYAMGLRLEHALYNTLELARLAQRLLDESPQPDLKPESLKKTP